MILLNLCHVFKLHIQEVQKSRPGSTCCNLSLQEAEAEGSGVAGQSGLHSEPVSKRKKGKKERKEGKGGGGKGRKVNSNKPKIK